LIIPQSRRADAEELIMNREEVLSISVQRITATQRSFKDWEYELFLKDLFLIRIILPAEVSEGLLDLLQTQFSLEEGYRINIFPVEATLPRPEEPKAPEELQKNRRRKAQGRLLSKASRKRSGSAERDFTKMSRLRQNLLQFIWS
jgi:hypothetical protein